MMIKILRWLLLPLSLIFSIIVFFRNKLYDKKIIKSYKSVIPVISIGNIEVGGVGKTPMVEYIIRLIDNKAKIATLSRGYGRKTSGFIIADNKASSKTIGDEPMQLFQKFPNCTIAVSENRVKAIKHLEKDVDIILMDDAFQHRKVSPGLSIVLVDYNTIDQFNLLLPTGNLREHKSNLERADYLVITKSPRVFSPIEHRLIEPEIRKYYSKEIFYSFIDYGELVPLTPLAQIEALTLDRFTQKTEIILFTGIAKTESLILYLESKSKLITHFEYSDHHDFTISDINKLQAKYDSIFSGLSIGGIKAIITTEKDAVRLLNPKLEKAIKDLPIYYLPIKADICTAFKERFDKIILDYVRDTSSNS